MNSIDERKPRPAKSLNTQMNKQPWQGIRTWGSALSLRRVLTHILTSVTVTLVLNRKLWRL